MTVLEHGKQLRKGGKDEEGKKEKKKSKDDSEDKKEKKGKKEKKEEKKEESEDVPRLWLLLKALGEVKMKDEEDPGELCGPIASQNLKGSLM